MKRIFCGWLAALALVLFSPFLAAQTALVVGQDYSVISPPMDTDNPAKIEVTMFFSFACGHCKELDRQLQIMVGIVYLKEAVRAAVSETYKEYLKKLLRESGIFTEAQLNLL